MFFVNFERRGVMISFSETMKGRSLALTPPPETFLVPFWVHLSYARAYMAGARHGQGNGPALELGRAIWLLVFPKERIGTPRRSRAR